MAKALKLETDEAAKNKCKIFLKKLESDMHFKSDFSGDLVAFDWVLELEKACPFIDIIVRNPKITLIQEENTVLVEKSKRINVSSIKDLAKHTEYINRFDKKNNDVQPSKILDVRNEETFNIYENRFLYTLINDMTKFVMRKEKELKNFELSDDKLLEYVGNSFTDTEKVRVELKVTSASIPSDNLDKKLKDEIRAIKNRIKRIKEYIASWDKSQMMKDLNEAHIPLIKPPVKKTNIILKNPNFRIAVALWEYLNKFEEEEDSKENLNNNGSEILKGFLDHSFLVDFFVLDSMVNYKREQKKRMASYAIVLLTQEIHRIIDLLLSCGINISEEDLLKMIANELKEENNNRLVGADDVRKKFKNVIDEYLERAENNL